MLNMTTIHSVEILVLESFITAVLLDRMIRPVLNRGSHDY